MSNNSNLANKKVAEKEDLFKISVSEKKLFDGDHQSKFLTSVELCEDYINPLFSVYQDFIGSIVNPRIANGGVFIDVELYFSHEKGIDPNQPSGFLPNDYANTEKPMNAVDRRRRQNSVSKARKSSITEEAQDGLSPYMASYTKDRDGKIKNWDKWTAERVENSQYIAHFQQKICSVIIGIDINQVVEEWYGRFETGSRQYYNLIPLRPLSSPGQSGVVNWLFSLSTLSEDKIIELGKKVGMIAAGRIPMVPFQR